MAAPQRVSDVDPNFEKQIRALRDANALASDSEGMQQGDWSESQWMTPAGWAGDVFDIDGMTQPFQRDKANQWFVSAIKDGQNPGVTGDCIITSVQVDYLACMERAFRVRHTMRRPRSFAQALGRRTGHGAEEGTYTQALEYVRALIKEASLQPPTSDTPTTGNIA